MPAPSVENTRAATGARSAGGLSCGTKDLSKARLWQPAPCQGRGCALTCPLGQHQRRPRDAVTPDATLRSGPAPASRRRWPSPSHQSPASQGRTTAAPWRDRGNRASLAQYRRCRPRALRSMVSTAHEEPRSRGLRRWRRRRRPTSQTSRRRAGRTRTAGALQPVDDEAVDLALEPDRRLPTSRSASRCDRPRRVGPGRRTSSTSGMRCGGLIGWRPGSAPSRPSPAVKDEPAARSRAGGTVSGRARRSRSDRACAWRESRDAL